MDYIARHFSNKVYCIAVSLLRELKQTILLAQCNAYSNPAKYVVDAGFKRLQMRLFVNETFGLVRG